MVIPSSGLRGRFDKDLGTWFLDVPDFRRGDCVLRVSARGLESQERAITFYAAGYSGEFVLVVAATPYWMVGDRKVPYGPEPRAVGFLIDRRLPQEDRGKVCKCAGKQGLKLEETELDRPRLLTRMVSRKRDGAAVCSRLQKELADLPQVKVLGDGIRLADGAVVFPSGLILVTLEESITNDRLVARLAPYSVDLLSMKKDAVSLRHRGETEAILEVCRDLAEMPWVEEVSPEFYNVTEPCAPGNLPRIMSTDVLATQQWHLDLLRVPEAWAALDAPEE